MDTVTQIALGAAVGEAVMGRQVGRRALLWGGACGLFPDLDILIPFGDDEAAAEEEATALTARAQAGEPFEDLARQYSMDGLTAQDGLFTSLGGVLKQPKGLAITLTVNWLVKPFTMAALGVLFFEHVFASMVPADDAHHLQAAAGVETGALTATDDATHRLVAGHERVAHAGEGGHPARPEQALGAGADPAEVDADHDVARGRGREAKPAERDPLGLL